MSTPSRDLAWLQNSTAATITVADTAEVMGVDPRTVGRGIDEGAIPAVKVGRRVLIPRLRLLAILTGSAGTNSEQRSSAGGSAA